VRRGSYTSQSDLRRGEAATWGPLPSIVASNFKRIDKNTLIASADLYVTKWRLTIYGVLWFRKGEKEWVGFPSKEWTDATGAKKYFPFAKFESRDDQDRFNEMAIAAIRQIAGDQP
jgi:hypothetical protein